MVQEKGKWVEDILDSTAGMQAARPRGGLYEQVRARLDMVTKPSRIPFAVISAAAACLVILFALNFAVIGNYKTANPDEIATGKASVQDIVDYYDLGSNNGSL